MKWYPDEQKYREMHHLKFDVLLRETHEREKDADVMVKEISKEKLILPPLLFFFYNSLLENVSHFIRITFYKPEEKV